jgi:hypothetical protein
MLCAQAIVVKLRWLLAGVVVVVMATVVVARQHWWSLADKGSSHRRLS